MSSFQRAQDPIFEQDPWSQGKKLEKKDASTFP